MPGMPALMGSILQCIFGVAPSSLIVLPLGVSFKNMPAANIMDNIPFLNILPFGMCTSMANPMVAAATAAALGVLTPMPCIPATFAPWLTTSPLVSTNKKPIADSNSINTCIYGGLIKINFPGVSLCNLS